MSVPRKLINTLWTMKQAGFLGTLILICLGVQHASGLADPGAEAIVVGGELVEEGTSVMLSCAVFNVSGERARSFRMEWRRDGVVLSRGQQVLSMDSRYRIVMIDGVSDRRDFVLTINRVNRSDAGRYICMVIVRDWYNTLPKKRASDSVDLRVQHFPNPPLCYHEGRSNVFAVGSPVIMKCAVDEGEPIVRTRWKGTNDMVLFAQETRHNGYVENTLSFPAAASHDGMTFTCKVTSDAYPGRSSTCKVGPIEVVDQAPSFEPIYSYSESSVNEADEEQLPEMFPAPPSTKSMKTIRTQTQDQLTTFLPTPDMGKSEIGVPILESTGYQKLVTWLSIFVMLFVFSVILNVVLLYKYLQFKRGKKGGKEVAEPSVCSGISNEQYMDMQNHTTNSNHDGEFYATIAIDNSRSGDCPYDSPRVSIVGLSPISNSASVTNGIYENMESRPITPPRTKRKSRLYAEESV